MAKVNLGEKLRYKLVAEIDGEPAAEVSAPTLESLEEQMGKSKLGAGIEEYLQESYYQCVQCKEYFDDKEGDLNESSEGELFCDDCTGKILTGAEQRREDSRA